MQFAGVAHVTFQAQGEATFLGGYNSGIEHSLFKNDLKVEAGINRVFARATRMAGDFTLSVARDGLAPASVTVTSKPVVLTDGLTDDPHLPQGYPPPPVRQARFTLHSSIASILP